MTEYTTQEYADMIIAYGAAGENARAAVRLYAERFPNRNRHPSNKSILRCIQRLRETGCVFQNRRFTAGAPTQIRVKDEERILRAFEENPECSIRGVARMLGLNSSLVHRIVHLNGVQLEPYRYQKATSGARSKTAKKKQDEEGKQKENEEEEDDDYQRVQLPLAGDEEQRINFCEEFLTQSRQNAFFSDRILWTGEVTFTPNGVFNSLIFLSWEQENLHTVHQDVAECRWFINVWAGIMANRIIGPYFFPSRLTGEMYAHFLRNKLPTLLEDVPLCEREALIFQHDGTPIYFSRQVRNTLKEQYPGRWMGQGGPIAWPPRSPDLHVLDYFVWNYIKNLIQHHRDGNEDEVQEAIIASFKTITPEMAYRATRDITQRVELCLREEGKHSKQFLH